MSSAEVLPPGLRALCRLALRAYPASLREFHREEMELVLLHRWRRMRGRMGARLRFLLFVARDLSASSAGRRRAARRPALSRRAGGGPSRSGSGDDDGDGRIVALLMSFLHDLRFGWRGLLRSPLFALTAILTVALGVGANAAIFSLVNAVLLEPLPYPEADRIQRIMNGRFASTRQVETLQEQLTSMAALSGVGQSSFTMREEAPERLFGSVVWPEHFEVFGQPPELGRGLRPEDTLPGADPVAVISHRLWTRAFGADPGILGRSVAIEGDGHPRRTVVGVLPAEHDPFPWPTELLVPALVEPGTHEYQDNYRYWLIGRVAADSTVAGAEAELRTLVERLSSIEDPIFVRDDAGRASLTSFHRTRVGDTGSTLLLLLGAVGIVLLIACANVANLLLARSGARSAEVAVRSALGAGRGRIVRQLLTESVLLSMIGGGLGLALAWLGVAPLARVLPTAIPRQAEVGVDLTVLLFALAASVAAGLVFGLAPALRAGGREAEVMRRAAPGAGAGGSRLHGLLLAGEVGLAVVLLVAAALLGKSLWQLGRVDPGFDPNDVVTLSVAPGADRYADAAQRAGYYERLLARVRALPGVAAAGAISQLPVSSGVIGMGISPDGNPVPEGDRGLMVSYRTLTPGAFDALGVRLLEGRLLTEDDDAGSRPVGVVNRRLARELWPDQSALGEEVVWGTGDPWFRVVGVIDDMHQSSLADVPSPEVYVSYAAEGTWLTALELVVRHRPGADLLPAVRAAVREVDDEVLVGRQGTLHDRISASLAGERGWAVVFGSFASLALALAAIGVFGVTSYLAVQRRHEMGVRVALGASRRDLVGVVLRTGFIPVGVGLLVGVGAALLGGRLMAGLLHEVAPADPLVIASAVAFLAVVAAAANLIPAWRASRVDPARALRAD